jgi:hypothetical protein
MCPEFQVIFTREPRGDMCSDFHSRDHSLEEQWAPEIQVIFIPEPLTSRSNVHQDSRHFQSRAPYLEEQCAPRFRYFPSRALTSRSNVPQDSGIFHSRAPYLEELCAPRFRYFSLQSPLPRGAMCPEIQIIFTRGSLLRGALCNGPVFRGWLHSQWTQLSISIWYIDLTIWRSYCYRVPYV